MTGPTLVWLDCETTRLDESRRPWEVAAIIRQPGHRDVEYHWFVDILDIDLTHANPVSLDIGRFWERHPQARWVTRTGDRVHLVHDVPGILPEPDGVYRESLMLTEVAELTAGQAVICGSNPAFDTGTLAPRMAHWDIEPGWHYHPEDVPGMARGWLLAQGCAAPRKSDEIARACGLDPDWYDRHTALGDCRLFRDLHRIVSQPPKRPPGGFWPVGGRQARQWRTCAGCGDDIWPNEMVYPADASGDTSDAAGVQCAVCEAQTVQAGMGW
ncbi:hypothetical protein [Micromonospora sp. WMMD737]|uniref:hypothetical protein n=1 Tax=Micromonospora sp. WMMD737 TaxID=3404113 RepID=UPI003B92F186